jgi:hypothetical protein
MRVARRFVSLRSASLTADMAPLEVEATFFENLLTVSR